MHLCICYRFLWIITFIVAINMQVVHPKALGIFFSYACINMFDKQCKCLQEIKERKRNEENVHSANVSYSLSSTAFIHSPAMRLQFQRRTLSLSLSLSFPFSCSRSLPCAHFCCSSLSVLPAVSFCCCCFYCDWQLFGCTVCVRSNRHTHAHNTHAQQKNNANKIKRNLGIDATT